ncbi:invasion associated locus B family protein [Bartonella ancashensis]|uniref:Signal recognition particle GTPase n=1 Tax=Bartonella ancashensis TaxID=1318743 RepID=A0A0M4LJL9_9HYPH|nr:invasion associated locus B family protein [Bartonella ancashensis]ALE04056.1 Signal recognition particle GTPase [Bartonella ancashensis]
MVHYQIHQKISFLSAFVCTFFSIFSGHSVAQISSAHDTPAPQIYGTWTKVCSLPPGTPNMQCEIVQDIRIQERQDITFRVIFYKLPKNQGTLMRVFVPIRVELRPGIAVEIDNTDIGTLEYRRCLGDHCVAETLLSDNLFQYFLKGKTATYTIFITPEQKIGGLINLHGLTEAYKNLP